ncbi:hypothetical protein FRC09_000023 [Ceratobasidium sp. 395]|nr:hypothetical protein FRC09_000023 [Ceratobasidium sp. 395]
MGGMMGGIGGGLGGGIGGVGGMGGMGGHGGMGGFGGSSFDGGFDGSIVAAHVATERAGCLAAKKEDPSAIGRKGRLLLEKREELRVTERQQLEGGKQVN